MSELTTCNYCNLEAIKADARKKKYCVTLMGLPKSKLGGIEVYVHPKDMPITQLNQKEEGTKKYWVAWMWVITDHCVC
jgi:hypothetical protein